MDKLSAELKELAAKDGFKLASEAIDDVLTYALFPQVGLKFLKNRGDASAFEPAPKGAQEDTFTVNVDGHSYVVKVDAGGDISQLAPLNGAPLSFNQAHANVTAAAVASGSGEAVPAPLAGNIWKVMVKPGDTVAEGDLIVILEAMKMETEIRTPIAGTVTAVGVREGDSIAVGDMLITVA